MFNSAACYILHFTDSYAGDVVYNNLIIFARYWKAVCTVVNMAWQTFFSVEPHHVKLE